MSPKVTTEDSSGKSKARFSAGQAAVRTRAARAVRIVFGVLATILALGAVLVVLRSNVNADNSIVQFITDTADAISGPFSRNDGIFNFTGKNAESKNALLNWGIAAIVYLVVGRLLANAITPKTSR
ncbi:MAG: hypothetical protein JWQ67_1597 [Marmoricola sp.]|nr:hypothetical protein [Marmoricola sp.]MCW2822612.1 hypothetical protein [Marmoricola sp.]MCW2827981.1 hypothetical protein [Marmoricola sp.]